MVRRAIAVLSLCIALLAAGAMTAAAGRAPAAADTLLTGLVAYWTLDEASGTRADATGGGNDLASVNSVGSAAGKIGQAADSVRTGTGYLSHADNADLSQGNNDFTVAGWFYLHTKPPEVWGSDTASFFTKWGTSDRREYGLLYRPMEVPSHNVTADTFEFVVANDGTEAGTYRAASLSLGGVLTDTWYFIVMWHDSVSDTINIQVNNGPVDSTAFSGGVFDSTSTFDLGQMASNPTGRLDGRVDELGIWDRVLTPAERTALYNAGAGLTYPFGEEVPPTLTPTITPTLTPTPTSTPDRRVFMPIVHGRPLPRWFTIKQDGFEGAFPNSWQLADLNGNNGHYYWGARDCLAASGSRSAWAVGGGDGAGLSCGSHYPDHTQSWMVYGPFSLAEATAADFSFQLWLDAEYGYDGLCYMASGTGVQFDGYCVTGNSGGWLARSLNLTSVPAQGDLRGDSSVWIALIFESDETITYPGGAFVDDVLVRECRFGSCPPSSSAQLQPTDVDGLIERPASLTRP